MAQYSISGININGDIYYQRPVFICTGTSGDVYATWNGSLDMNCGNSILIYFPNGFMSINPWLYLNDSGGFINGSCGDYLYVKPGDTLELHNIDSSAWEILNYDYKCVDITYKDLKWLRDNSYLIPGMKYRIIDYVTMDEYCNPDARGVLHDISLPFHYSAEHPFDIIVTAETKKTLSPIASATHSSHLSGGYIDTYFDDCDLSKWKLWYSLDCTDFDFGYDWGIEPGEYIKPIDGVDNVFYGYNFTNTCIPGQMPTTATTRVYITPFQGFLRFYAPYLNPNKVFQFGINPYSGLTTVSDITQGMNDSLGVTYYTVTMSSGKKYSNLRPISYSLLGAEDNIQDSLVFYETTLASLILVNISSKTIQATLTLSGGITANADYARLTKGVIYRMIDEWGNDAPYDFKNILSYTPGFTYTSFLFGELGGTDNSLNGTSSNNIIHPSISGTKQRLPYIHLGQTGAKNCTVGKNCYNIFILPTCHNVTIGNEASTVISGENMGLEIYDVSIGDGCNGIRIEAEGNDIYNVTIGNQCKSITILNSTEALANIHIGNNCYNIEEYEDMINSTIGNNCHDISCDVNCTFGNNCYTITCGPYNTFGDDCHSIDCSSNNIFGNNCYTITCNSTNIFGNYCRTIECAGSNTFGNNCYNITCGTTNIFGNNCYNITCGNYNTFGNYCRIIYMTNTGNSNTFGQNCQNIYSGDYSSYNTFGNYVGYIVFATSRSSASTETNRRAYCQYNVLHDGVRYVVIYSTTTPSNTAILRNVHIDTPATYLRTSYKYTGASATTGAAINTSSIQRYKFTASDSTTTLS